MSKPTFLAIAALAYGKVALGLIAWSAGVITGVQPRQLPEWGGSLFTSLLIVITFCPVAMLLHAGKSRGPQAKSLGLYLLLIATAFANVLARNGHPLGGLSAFVRLIHLEAALPVALWQFVAVFPRGDVRRADADHSTVDILAIGPIVVFSILLERVSTATLANAAYWPLMMLVQLPAVPVLVVRAGSAPPRERRRIGFFVAGIIFGMVPMSLDIVLRLVSPAWKAIAEAPVNKQVVSSIAIAALLTVPVTTSYSVLVAHVFDFRLVVRSAVQYALARTTILALLVAPLAILARLIYENRTQTVQQVLSGPSAVMSLALAALAAAALIGRQQMLTVIDRRFFRDESDSQTVLLQAIEHCRAAGSPREMAALVTESVSKGLKVGAAAFLAAEPTGEFSALTGNAAFLRADSGLVALLAASDLPLVATDTHDHALIHRLDAWSKEWIRASAAHLLVPARSLEGHLLGVLVLGAKKSELDYSRNDQQLLAAIGSAAGHCLTRFAHVPSKKAQRWATLPAESEDAPARECPGCGVVHSATAVFCGCGNLLVESDIPQVLASKYTVHKRIGRGGVAVVYSATDRALLRKVAIKTLPRSSKDHLERLRREAQAMAQLQHPHLAIIYELEMWQQRPCLVVELLERGTLAERLEAGPLPIPEIAVLGRQIGEGLRALHDRDVLHRDVKPSNIGFATDGVAKLLDFGLARALPGSFLTDDDVPHLFRTTSGVLAGTPAYLSPEAFDGEPPSKTQDLWALAVVLLESGIGRNPFLGSTIADTYDRIRKGTARDGVIPDDLGGMGVFLRQALHDDHTKRPQEAAEFLKILSDTVRPHTV